MGKLPGLAPNGAGKIFFQSNPDLVDILGRTDLNVEIFYFFFYFLDPKFPDFQVLRFPDAAADGRTLRSQPDPSPNAPRDQIRRKGPCCDNQPKRLRATPRSVNESTVWRQRIYESDDTK